MDLSRLEEEQKRLAEKIILRDDFDKTKIRYIAGIDHHSIANKLIVGIVVYDIKENKVVDSKHYIDENPMKYVTFFLAYRILPAVLKAYEKLTKKPDLLVINAAGILHPRRLGAASHIGLIFDKPAIGITKTLPCGEIRERRIMLNNEIVAAEVLTKEGAKPIYVSPGHRITLKTAIEIVKSLIRPPHKLPEPLHLAHKMLKKLTKG